MVSLSDHAYAFEFPDTGQTKCYSDVSPYDEIPCEGTGQDGEYDINPMSYTDNGNGTVTDNNTGLMWQKCSTGQNNDDTCSGTALDYNWYRASGTYHAWYNPDSQDVCGSLNLGGSSDWRLPSKKELITIVDYAVPYPGPTIRTAYFPNTKLSHQYWSSPNDANHPYIGFAWYVNFTNGYVNFDSGVFANYVRCVRGGQFSPSFTDNGNGTVTDNKTGLVWQQGDPGTRTWGSALSYCEGFDLGNKTDWRLPNVKELESITDDTKYNPAIDTNYFPNAHASGYWSSTTSAGYPPNTWYVDFDDGAVYGYGSKGGNFYVRCVRGGQPPVVDVTGCIDLGGSPLVNKKVILKQTGEVNQTTTTDSGGCYVFLNAISGKAFSVQVNGPVLSSPVPVINGCAELQGSAMSDRKVLLKQDNELNKSKKTDIEGCYSFSNAVPDKKFKLLIKGPVVP